MEIKNVHVSFNGMTEHSFRADNGLLHKKELFQFSVVQLEKGTYRVSNDKDSEGEPVTGEIFVAVPGEKQYIRETKATDFCYGRYFFMNIDINDGYSIDLFYEFPVTLPEASAKRVTGLLDRLSGNTNAFEVKRLCYHIAEELFANARERKELPNPKVMEVINYIRRHYAEKLNISHIAKEHFISESTLYELFKKYCNTTPVSYINNWRMVNAAKLLTSTDFTISEVAERTGFEDLSYFNRCFKRKYGLSPKEYRKKQM